MKKFDPQYVLLSEMYRDGYFPDFLVDKVKGELEGVIGLLEAGETGLEAIQARLDEMTQAINDLEEEFEQNGSELEEEFEQNGSELETVARESIGSSVAYILEWFDLPINVEDAIRERDW